MNDILFYLLGLLIIAGLWYSGYRVGYNKGYHQGFCASDDLTAERTAMERRL